jgi:hypothetical protein
MRIVKQTAADLMLLAFALIEQDLEVFDEVLILAANMRATLHHKTIARRAILRETLILHILVTFKVGLCIEIVIDY